MCISIKSFGRSKVVQAYYCSLLHNILSRFVANATSNTYEVFSYSGVGDVALNQRSWLLIAMKMAKTNIFAELNNVELLLSWLSLSSKPRSELNNHPFDKPLAARTSAMI